MEGGLFACLCRAIITADNELLRFIELSEKAGLEPLGLSITRDRFSAQNEDKLGYVLLRFWVRHQERVVNAVGKVQAGKVIDDITCRNRINLVEFHRRLLEQRLPGWSSRVRDVSEWGADKDSGQHLHYEHYLAQFVTGGVLFENFRVDEEEERKFTHDRVIPAFEKVRGIFGVKPLIVRLFSEEEADDPKWWRYPDELYLVVKAMLRERNGEAGA